MLFTLLVNLAIALVVVIGLVVTANPLCILALFFLRDSPPIFMAPPGEHNQPMGFTADLEE